MLLVLGRPGSGCSSLLKTLGESPTRDLLLNVLGNDRGGFQDVTGKIDYDGLSLETIAKSHGGDVVCARATRSRRLTLQTCPRTTSISRS